MNDFILKIREFFTLLRYDFESYFGALYDELRLKWAIKLAEAKKRAYCKRYYVIRDYKERLTVVCNSDIKRLKKMHLMNARATHLDVMRECLYYTNVNDNDAISVLPPKERAKRKAKWLESLEEYRRSKYERRLKRLRAKKARAYKKK